jgi:DNA-binding ferritin-like protein
MEGTLKDTQVLACERLKGTATESQVKEIKEAIKQINELLSSIQEGNSSIIQNYYGNGNNTSRRAQHTRTGDLYHNEIKGGRTF